MRTVYNPIKENLCSLNNIYRKTFQKKGEKKKTTLQQGY